MTTPSPSFNPARVSRLVETYRAGGFFMSDDRTGRINAYTADPRAIIPLTHDAGLHVPRSLRKRVRDAAFRITSDACFEEVILACARRRREGTWISKPLAALYIDAHRAGHAHSVEAWLDTDGESRLVGGLYGVAVGAVFCGESMFSRPELGGTDASKVCLVHLINHLNARRFQLLDSQLSNPHIAQFGSFEISHNAYVEQLARLRDDERPWHPFGAL
jgi:leucyl/phenylalanyl-tRNA--protein transferase